MLRVLMYHAYIHLYISIRKNKHVMYTNMCICTPCCIYTYELYVCIRIRMYINKKSMTSAKGIHNIYVQTYMLRVLMYHTYIHLYISIRKISFACVEGIHCIHCIRSRYTYGVASGSRIDKMISVFCKRAL